MKVKWCYKISLLLAPSPRAWWWMGRGTTGRTPGKEGAGNSSLMRCPVNARFQVYYTSLQDCVEGLLIWAKTGRGRKLNKQSKVLEHMNENQNLLQIMGK
jgi:hypothetical protein